MGFRWLWCVRVRSSIITNVSFWRRMSIVMECACACAGGVSRGYRRTHFTLSQSFCELKTSLIKSVKSEKNYQAIWMIDLVLLSSLGVMWEHKIIQLRGGIAELELRACDFWATPLSTHTHTHTHTQSVPPKLIDILYCLSEDPHSLLNYSKFHEQ